MDSSKEGQLLAGVQRGDRDALGGLIELHRGRLYNVCLRMVSNRDDASEITQEAMLKIIEHIDDFNYQSAVSTWMIRIVMNLSISHLRKRKLRNTASLEADRNPNGSHDDQAATLRDCLVDGRELSPDQAVQNSEGVERLREALAMIDEDFRAVLVLRDIDQMDYHEIAKVLSIPVGTVKSRLFRARLALRQMVMRPDTTGFAARSEQEAADG